MYTPMLEVLGARELAQRRGGDLGSGARDQVTLSRRKHMRLDVGARIPVNERTGDRQVQLATYLLWDWYEGSPLYGLVETCIGAHIETQSPASRGSSSRADACDGTVARGLGAAVVRHVGLAASRATTA